MRNVAEECRHQNRGVLYAVGLGHTAQILFNNCTSSVYKSINIVSLNELTCHVSGSIVYVSMNSN